MPTASGGHGSLAYEVPVGRVGLAAVGTVAYGAEAVVAAVRHDGMAAKTGIVDIPQP
jgi:hypothetical protein